MLETITLLTTSITAFFAHDWAEKKVTNGGSKPVRLIIKGYQIHHSFFGMLFIAYAVIFLSGTWAFVFFGYGIGNIWQHKITHNRVQEKGLVFISKCIKIPERTMDMNING